MPVYEPLLDDYLWDYFQNPKTRRHLTDLGLVARDGTIIDHKDFKYAQIRLQKMEYERNILKQDQERILDREIEIAIRKKAKTDKMRMQEHFQSMPDPASRAGKPYPEFLQNYPVTMWRTVLLYAQRPPSLTHVGVPRQRPKTSRRPNTSKTPLNDSEKVHQLFSNARKEFDAGNLEATSNILCEIITLIKKPISQTSLNGDHMQISQAIQDAIEKAGIFLTGTERLLIGYIQKLGGDVETVIQHLRQGRQDSHPPSAMTSAPQQPTPPQEQPRKSITARPQSARPNRKAQFPNAGSFTNIIGTASSPNIPVLDRPNSARKNRDADFPAASSFSIGNQSESVTSVHLERPASPRLNRGVSVNENGEKGGVKALEEERAEIEAALESELAGFERVEESGSGAVAGAEQAEDEYKYEEEGFESGVAGNATESSEAHAVNEASPKQQSTAVEDLGLHEEETTVESVLKEVEPKVEDENKPISDGVQASEKSSEDAPAEEAAGLSESANPEDIAASTEESSPSEEAATTDPTQQEQVKAQDLRNLRSNQLDKNLSNKKTLHHRKHQHLNQQHCHQIWALNKESSLDPPS
ncbi:hypothetical protein BCR33DRAFT_308272 [Rhizoclosmatium globosum]|uniref:Uncharacterized protein n=1 Tax=Rhizoclosmatium globosum TaxID=329046 RepID=A0A1Y2C5K7_9FUNG|nr:hypothetical protein BCR33DRAFT_308272 [Rhizoclosmatium globosum]|eukprot:ORY42330.1 hypothetical protein BCR33DRAFT_308272 [Rhizoclosmatium globosum]